MHSTRAVGLGLIGCGSFGRFCLDAFGQIPEVRIVAVADERPGALEEFVARYGAAGCADAASLIARDDVDLVHVATPPDSHYPLALAALRAGKHVLCEKPLALHPAHGEEMLAEAAARGRICPVNFVMRYNEVARKTADLLQAGVLGEPLGSRLTNCAQDSQLLQGHWFWDREVSGGIFVEHGVHFFDLYRWWFGPAAVLSAHAESHRELNRQSRVTCLLRHDGGVLASHYHGFDQVELMDRTDHRIVCELGDIRVEGWIPLAIRVDASLDASRQERLLEMLPGANVEAVVDIPQPRRDTTGRGKLYRLSRRIRLSWVPDEDKQAVYTRNVRDLLCDQLAFLRDASHPRSVIESNGLDALHLAAGAAAIATHDQSD